MSGVPSSEILDLEDRDPNKLNHHIQVGWEDIFAEPESIRSPECAWSFSKQCFRFSRNGCYTCLTVICAPIASCIMGFCFACFSFEFIWCVMPCLRMWKISCGATRNFCKAITHALIIPCTEACGFCFSQIKVRTQVLSEDEREVKEKETDFLIV